MQFLNEQFDSLRLLLLLTFSVGGRIGNSRSTTRSSSALLPAIGNSVSVSSSDLVSASSSVSISTSILVSSSSSISGSIVVAFNSAKNVIFLFLCFLLEKKGSSKLMAIELNISKVKIAVAINIWKSCKSLLLFGLSRRLFCLSVYLMFILNFLCLVILNVMKGQVAYPGVGGGVRGGIRTPKPKLLCTR